MKVRIERDSLGEVEVPHERYWGAQTQRAIGHFRIGTERMPDELIRAIALVKLTAARVNASFGDLDSERAEAIERAAREIMLGQFAAEFPLAVWQTGSGTQTNMNVNEVIAHRAAQILNRNDLHYVHPNDHVNRSQSTNDVFPTALHVALTILIQKDLLPELEFLRGAFMNHASRHRDLVKVGRTHLQDAAPLTLGQEFSGYAEQLAMAASFLKQALENLRELPIGGTAVGTGLNSRRSYAKKMVESLSSETGITFVEATNRFAAMAGKEAVVHASSALRMTATSLMKIANDIRWLASGPRAGIGELELPANEPGSSIMPGKVNPTQCEAVVMVAMRVMGNDVTVGFAGASGNFELNACLPVLADASLQSARLLADATRSFRKYCVEGMHPVEDVIADHLARSLMLATALTPKIGYDRAAEVAKTAHEEKRTLREVTLEKGYLTAQEFDELIDPSTMLAPMDDP